MAEDQTWEASTTEAHRPCANNCGFMGTPATLNLCSSCYKDYCFKQQQQQQQITSTTTTSSSSSCLSSSTSSSFASSSPSSCTPPVACCLEEKEKAGRCFTCRKRVGLTGFRCRCGIVFCGVHRYPEKHGCGFDYKKVGREDIARANPLVIADKLLTRI